ncbi:MAG: AAA family ATPase, partial [Prosthecobacter sp.]|nr:AAA family ATPase [Prosthecobacter sp.]
PLKPITLIFGPNSAGKSALLRSLLVARHAILNGKLSKSEGAGERHPGSYADIVRNGNSNPILFGFTVQPDGKSREEALELGLAWKENLGGVETVALSLRQRQSEVVTYLANGDSKHLQVKNFGEELRQRMTSARHESDTEGKGDDLVHRSIKNRLSLQKNVSLPGADVDHFRNEEDEADVLRHIEESCKNGKILDLALVAWMRSIKTTDDSFKSAITTQIKAVDTSLRDALSNLIYHGPIRPICDEITKARKSEPGMMEWWNLAETPKLLAKVNDWLSSGEFKTKSRLEFDRLFPDSALRQLLHILSEGKTIKNLIQASIVAKLESDPSALDRRTSDMAGCLSDDDYEDEDELWKEAEQQARDALVNEYEEEYDCIRDEGDIEEAEKFLIGGMNAILSSLQDMLESVRQGKAARTEGGFDSAKIRFVNLGSKCAVAPSNMGIGFSQMMPLVASAFGSENSLIAIEQPELHIHPALQTELADLFIQSAKERDNRFLIETHSEHLILRVLRRIRETSDQTLPPDKQPIRPEDVAVLYVQPGENGSEVVELPVTPDGDFAVPWPGGFFAERTRELF